jgi:hypothetical protein
MSAQEVETKKPYAKSQLTVLGTVAELTRQGTGAPIQIGPFSGI